MKRRVFIMGRNRNVIKGLEGKDQSRKVHGTIRGNRGKMRERGPGRSDECRVCGRVGSWVREEGEGCMGEET